MLKPKPKRTYRSRQTGKKLGPKNPHTAINLINTTTDSFYPYPPGYPGKHRKENI